jgi:hypothetical protein
LPENPQISSDSVRTDLTVCRTSLSLVKLVWEEPLMVYKLLLHLQFCNKFVKTLAFRGNGEKKCLTYTETQWPIGRERNLVSYWLAAFSLGFYISMQPMKTSGDTVGGWAQQV